MIFLMFEDKKVLEMEGERKVLNEDLLPNEFIDRLSREPDELFYGASLFDLSFDAFLKSEIIRMNVSDDEKNKMLNNWQSDNIKILAETFNKETKGFWYLQE